MEWSKLRANTRALICPELRRRIDFHITKYTPRSIRARRGWITVDGKQFLDCGYYSHFIYGLRPYCGLWVDADERDWALTINEKYSPQQMGSAMRDYLDMPVKLALKSKNPFLRALAIVDRRIGRRTLESLEIADDEHSIVKEFYRLRMSTLLH